MKTLSKFGLGCCAVLLFFIVAIITCGVIFYFNSDNWIARSPARICKEAGFKLPAYKTLEKDDNMGRDSSSWSWYYWRIKLKKPLSKKDIRRLKKLVKDDPNWYEIGNNIFEYSKDYVEAGYGMDNFSSPQIHIFIDSNKEVSIKYIWYDAFF